MRCSPVLSPHRRACRSVEKSVALGRILTELAKRHPSTKFMRIIATNCVEGFPDSQVPAVLVYHDGDNVATLSGKNFGGTLMNPECASSAVRVVLRRSVSSVPCMAAPPAHSCPVLQGRAAPRAGSHARLCLPLLCRVVCARPHAGVEYALAEVGAVKTDLEYDPRDEAQRTRFTHIRKAQMRMLDEEDDV